MPASSLPPACHARLSLSGAGLLVPGVRLKLCLHALHLSWWRLHKGALQPATGAAPWCGLMSHLSHNLFPQTAMPCWNRHSAASCTPPALLPEHYTRWPLLGTVSRNRCLPACRWLQTLQAQLQRLGLTGHAMTVCHVQHLVAAVALPQQGHAPAALLRLAGVCEQMELCSAAAVARSRAGRCPAT